MTATTKRKPDLNVRNYEKAQKLADEFNREHGVGTAVRFKGDLSMIPQHTWTLAYVENHTAVIELDDQDAPVVLDDIEVAE